ncbi:unnamed protein product [Lota lota]
MKLIRVVVTSFSGVKLEVRGQRASAQMSLQHRQPKVGLKSGGGKWPSPVGYRAPVMGNKLAISSLRWRSSHGEKVAIPRGMQSSSHRGEGSHLQPETELKSWGRKWPSSGEIWSPSLGGRTVPSPPR